MWGPPKPKVAVKTTELCKACDGSGFDKALVVVDCSKCGGVGYVDRNLIEESKQIITEFPCPESWMDYMVPWNEEE